MAAIFKSFAMYDRSVWPVIPRARKGLLRRLPARFTHPFSIRRNDRGTLACQGDAR